MSHEQPTNGRWVLAVIVGTVSIARIHPLDARPRPQTTLSVTLEIRACQTINGGANRGNHNPSPHVCGVSENGAVVESSCDGEGKKCAHRRVHPGGKDLKLKLAPGTYRFGVDYASAAPSRACTVAMVPPRVVSLTKAETITLTYDQACAAP